MKSMRTALLLLVAAVVFVLGAPQAMAQTASTGALTGTVTDPSGGVIAGAKVTVTNVATGQQRSATTDSKGSYLISLLPPGTYSVHFEAAGFKSVDVPSITINVTETPTLNHRLELGTATQQVTVEANTQTIQTQSATNGTVVSGQEITNLPLVTRNYTQILDLSPGVVSNVANASAMGNGTQNVSANGQGGISNSYSMDGANITQYTSGGAAQMGSMPGIAIPNPDTIQEFKVQTSQYDAGYGRNAGANVEVITKTGSNHFHGDVWEFNRNNFFNANDFFYKFSELKNGQPNKPQVLKQNTFGFTLGGPIKHNKIFFFGSYQGFRQLNGIATNGFASGYEPAVYMLPWNDYADYNNGNGPCSDLRCTNNTNLYKQYLGTVFGPGTATCPSAPDSFSSPTTGFPNFTPINCNLGYNTGVLIQNDGTGISNTALALLQAKGGANTPYNQGGFWIASAPQNCALIVPGVPSSGCQLAISLPTRANENQYMLNTQYNLSPKNTLYENYFYQSDPEIQSFDCIGGGCNPGSPSHVTYISHTGSLRLTSILTNNLINEARFTFQRNGEQAIDPTTLTACNLPNGFSIIPLNNNGQSCSANVPLAQKDFGTIPEILVGSGFFTSIFGSPTLYSPSLNWDQGINFAGTGENIDNEFQIGDQVSWSHGIQTIRFGFDAEWDRYNNKTPASGRGQVSFDNVADFLTSSSGNGTIPGDPTYNDGTPVTGQNPSTPNTLPPQTCGIFGTGYCTGGASPFALKGLIIHYNRIGAYDWFIQDDIRVSPKLTVNAGLRWEYDGYPSDKLGQMTNVWASQLAKVNTGSFFLNGGTTLAGFVVPKNFDPAAGLVGPDGSTGVLVNSNNTLVPGSPLDNFMPRLGVAWQPFGHKFVVRAGYGWFYDRAGSIFLVDGQLNVPPYSATASGTTVSNRMDTLHSPFQGVVNIPLTWTPRSFTVAGDINATNVSINSSNLGYTANAVQLADRLPLNQLYNLDLQYDLGHGWLIDVGYVGSHSIHLLNQGFPVNVAHLAGTPATVLCGGVTGDCAPQDLAMFNNPNFPGGNPLPFNDPANTTPVTVNLTQNIPARVSYLGYTAAAPSTTTTLGDAKYNSLQAQVRHSFSNGFLLQAAYTWSKNLTNINSAASGELDTGNTDFGTSGSNNPLNFAQSYGPYSAERSQRLIVSYSYDLPWKSTSGFSGKVLSGWTISGVTTLQNGQPMTVTGVGGTIYGGSVSRAFLTKPVYCGANGVCKSGIAVATPGSTKARVLSDLPGSPTYNPAAPVGWINPNAFVTTTNLTASSPYCIGGVYASGGSPDAPCGANPNFFATPGSPAALGADYLGAGTGWGNAPVGIITGPGQWNWDMSIQKNTKVTEWGTLQFRAEFYNIWNHAQFNNPISTGVGTTLGRINSTSVTPRVIQLGLKFLF